MDGIRRQGRSLDIYIFLLFFWQGEISKVVFNPPGQLDMNFVSFPLTSFGGVFSPHRHTRAHCLHRSLGARVGGAKRRVRSDSRRPHGRDFQLCV